MTKLDGQTKASVMKQVEDSLRRLKIDTIDLLQMHEVIRPTDPARMFGPEGGAEAYLQLKQQGKIRFVGFTGHKDPAIHLAMLDQAQKNGFRFDTVQMPLNVLDHHFNSFEQKVLPRLKAEQIGALGMKPIASGEALKSGVVSAEECLRYALSVGSDVTITGCDSVGILEQALKVAFTFQPMQQAEKDALLARTAPKSDGSLEAYKLTEKHDTTNKHPEFLG